MICEVRNMDYIVRWVTESDARELGLIHSSSWKVAYKGILPDDILDKITPEKREAYFTNSIRGQIEKTAVIELDSMIAGFITLGGCRDTDLSTEHGEVWGIYLSPDKWRLGIGSILIGWGQNELASSGFKRVSLWVLEDNHNARAFYEKHGFIHDGTVKKMMIGKEINEMRYIKIID